jgi:hypothetical protein
MPQTASGRPSSAQQATVLDDQYRVFVATADVAPQRHAAYTYCQLTPRGTRSAIPCPAGGELHQADGTIIPVAPYDWVVEQPDGTLTSITSEEVADHWDFHDGPDDMKQAHDRTREYVKHARQAPRRNPPVKVDNAPVKLHPDHGPAAAVREQERTAQQVQDAYAAQAAKARKQLEIVVNVATKRKLVTAEQAADWLDLGVQPEHIDVRFDQVLGTYQVTRTVPHEPGPDAGDEDTDSDGDTPAKPAKGGAETSGD